MKHSLCYLSIALACMLLFSGCRASEETPKGEVAEKVREAVKDVVTKDFKHYEAAKKSLAESAQRSKEELDLIDKELKQGRGRTR